MVKNYGPLVNRCQVFFAAPIIVVAQPIWHLQSGFHQDSDRRF